MAAGPHFGWPKITFDRISCHFRSIHNFFSKWPPAAILKVRFAPKTIGFFHYMLSMAMSYMKLIGEFMTQLETPQAFLAFLYKMAARGHFVFPIDAKNHKVLVIWDLNGYGEYEFDWCICDKVMACTSVGVWRRNQKHNTPEMFKFWGYNYLDKLKIYLTKIQFILENHTMKIYLDTQEPHHSRVKFILEYDIVDKYNLPWYLRTIFSECKNLPFLVLWENLPILTPGPCYSYLAFLSWNVLNQIKNN